MTPEQQNPGFSRKGSILDWALYLKFAVASLSVLAGTSAPESIVVTQLIPPPVLLACEYSHSLGWHTPP